MRFHLTYSPLRGGSRPKWKSITVCLLWNLCSHPFVFVRKIRSRKCWTVLLWVCVAGLMDRVLQYSLINFTVLIIYIVSRHKDLLTYCRSAALAVPQQVVYDPRCMDHTPKCAWAIHWNPACSQCLAFHVRTSHCEYKALWVQIGRKVLCNTIYMFLVSFPFLSGWLQQNSDIMRDLFLCWKCQRQSFWHWSYTYHKQRSPLG